MFPRIEEYQPQFTKKREFTLAPFIKISHNYMIVYNKLLSDSDFTTRRFQNLFKDSEQIPVYQGEMSKGARKRLQAACELMYAISTRKYYNHPLTGKRLSFRIGLLTLTLAAPQQTITDRQIKKELLEPMIRKLRKWGLKNYVWKAEYQKNGNLHFHIFVDCYMDITDTRNIWNRLQAKFHFINNFRSKHGHTDPNSTDIKPVQTEKKMIVYMLKYMMKPTKKAEQMELGQERELKDLGKCWDCSKALKTPNDSADFATKEDFDWIQLALHYGQISEVKTDHCYIYYFREPDKETYLPQSHYLGYLKYLESVRNVN